MKQIPGTWFEVKVRYEQTQEDGMNKMVTETYVYKAEDFGEAYDKATKDMSTSISGEFEITAMKIAQYKEIIIQDDRMEEKYYRVKVILLFSTKRHKKRKRPPATTLSMPTRWKRHESIPTPPSLIR